MTLHMNDILNSPMNKPKEEVSSKTLTFQSGEPTKPLSIKIDKTTNGPDGSTTKFTVSMEHEFTSPEELKGILDAVGYCQKKSWMQSIRDMVRR